MSTGPNNDMTNSVWFAVGCVVAAIIPTFMFRGEYLRLNMEQARKNGGTINSEL